MKEKDPKTSENLKTTLIVCFVMLFVMAGTISLICFFTNKQLLARIDLPFITTSQQKVGEKQQYYVVKVDIKSD